MAFADRDGDSIVVKTEYRDKDLIRQCPGALYDVNAHVWRIPLSWAGCLTLRGLFRERLEISDDLNKWAGEFIEDFVKPSMRMREELDAPGDADLYPFQRAGVRWLSHVKTGLLTDEMGTGKTIQSIRTAVQITRELDNPFPALVVCPNSMKRTWQKEFAAWWPGVEVVIMEGGRTSRLKQIELVQQGKAHVLVANWESLRGHSRLAPYGSIRLKRCVDCDPSLRNEVQSAEVDLNAAKERLDALDATMREFEGEPELEHQTDDPNREAQRAVFNAQRDVLQASVADLTQLFKEAERKHARRNCERCARELNDITWKTIWADELHKGKEPRAKQTRALWALRTDGTKYRYGLTGTPIANAPEEFWSALHFIDPKAWPTRSKYIDRWCLQSFNPFGGMTIIGLKPETKEEFFKITDPYVRRMPKALVLKDLPPKVYSTRYVEMSPKQKKAYEAMRDDMVAQLDDAGGGDRLVAVNPLTQLTRLTQFASSFGELVTEEVKNPDTGLMEPKVVVKLTDPSNKVDALVEELESLNGKPCGVFAQSRQLIELASARLEKLKIPHVLIVGNQSAFERQLSIERFQRGEVAAVLATVGAGGIGITLTRGDTCIFLQRSWSMIENAQAEDRFHRIGSEQHESINIIDIVSQGTIEEGQRLALEAKGDRMQEILRDKEFISRLLGRTK